MATDLCPRCLICDVCDVKDVIDEPPKCKNFVQRPMTHYDQLHAMSVEELAEKLAIHVGCNMCPGWSVPCGNKCAEYWFNWLNEVCEDSTMEAEK